MKLRKILLSIGLFALIAIFGPPKSLVTQESILGNLRVASEAAINMAIPSASAEASNESAAPREGYDYLRIPVPQPTKVAANQIEVLEFFWYACPHCYALEPYAADWLKTKPNFVSFSRVHVSWEEPQRSLARLHFVMTELGKAKLLSYDEAHTKVFNAIHVGGNPLIGADPNDRSAAEMVQRDFMKGLGVSARDFDRFYHGPEIEAAMEQTDQLAKTYRITHVPMIVVNGRYIVDIRSAGSPERVMPIVDELIRREAQRQSTERNTR